MKNPQILTARQYEVADRVSLGQTNKEIGFQLGISEAGVAIHLRAIFAKIGVRSRVELCRWHTIRTAITAHPSTKTAGKTYTRRK